MGGMEELKRRGIRLTLEAEKLIDEKNVSAEDLTALEKKFITADDVSLILKKKEEASAEELAYQAQKVSELKASEPPPKELSISADPSPSAQEEAPAHAASGFPSFRPLAKEYSAKIEIREKLDVTGNSRTKGEVEDFVAYFRNRYERLSAMLRSYPGKYPEADLSSMKSLLQQKVRIIAFVSDIRTTKNGNMMLEVEDLTGNFKVIISQKDEKVFEKAKRIVRDDTISIDGKVLEAFIIAEDFEWPDIPLGREPKESPHDLAAVYLSDLHLGSRHFLDKYFERFVEWINGRGSNPELAGRIKYIFVAGDMVDGIGIYPEQEKDLVVSDIFKQYSMFSDFIEQLPDYIEVIVSPGNHDAVRRAEPMPALSDEVFRGDVTKVGSPSFVSVDGFEHLIYHGTSADSWIATLSCLNYNQPEKVMEECLKRRHLSPMFGGNAIVPEKLDYMVIERVPDIVHFGHVHKNGYKDYRGTLIINSGTFQDTTDFQQKQGHVPTPAKVPVYEFKNKRLRTLDFTR